MSGKVPHSAKINLIFIRKGTIEDYLIWITLDWKTGRRTEVTQIGNNLLRVCQTRKASREQESVYLFIGHRYINCNVYIHKVNVNA